MEVGEKNGLLTVESAEFGKSTIENTSRIDIFYESNYDSDLMFQRNDEDMVTGININVKSQGMILRAERELPEKEEVAELEEVAEEEMSLNLYAGKYEFNYMLLLTKEKVLWSQQTLCTNLRQMVWMFL
jgi:hypothetical protein